MEPRGAPPRLTTMNTRHAWFRSLAAAAVAAVAAVGLSACGDTTGTDSAKTGGGSVGGPPTSVTVDSAAEARTGDVLRVRGAVVAGKGGAMMCDALAESHPPSCAGGGLPLRGFDPGVLPPGSGSAAGVRWAEGIELIAVRTAGGLAVRQE